MNYISIFSGIEAATVAWEPLGWEPLAFSEIDPFCNEILTTHFPNVSNLGDIKEVDWKPYEGRVDILVGGSPCQSFSVAGKRGGLVDERGQLMYEYIRAVRDIRPKWVLWENVPGVLSQSNGDAFNTFQGELEKCGYSLAWRTLDSQFFGVAQRRRRVFLVGHCRVGCATAVLFERESLFWDYASSKEKRKALADKDRESSVTAVRVANTGANGIGITDGITHTLDAATPEAIAFTQNTRDEVRLIGGDGSVVGALCASPGTKNQAYVVRDTNNNVGAELETAPNLRAGENGTDRILRVRKLTPLECERLQGFPDGYTDIDGASNAKRYRVLGNSMAVPVMRWIGKRIELVDSMYREIMNAG